MEEHIRENYQRVLAGIGTAARACGRDPASVQLVVVTKTHPLEIVQAAIAAGARHFGENYAEEAAGKIRALQGLPIRWHMIGHVQSRKADLVAVHFDMLHSLDSLKLAERLQRFAQAAGRTLPVLFELNVSGEESKFGLPAWEESHWDGLATLVRAVSALPNLAVRGLMTMPPYAEQAEPSRPYFIRLRAWRDRLQTAFPSQAWDQLSMGTSSDYLVAVQEGATLVRVGTAILGARPRI